MHERRKTGRFGRGWWPILVVAALLLGIGAACSKVDQAAEPPPTPDPMALSAEPTNLVFRYLNATRTKVETASTVDAVPMASRSEVVVLDPNHPPPPGWEYVVNLNEGLPQTIEAREGFSFQVAGAPKRVKVGRKTATAPPDSKMTESSNKNVVMFSTQGCPYCSKARRFFNREKIGFSEYDLERDSQRAERKLRELAKSAGADRSGLAGVPIIFVGRNIVKGFDQRRLRKLLGI